MLLTMRILLLLCIILCLKYARGEDTSEDEDVSDTEHMELFNWTIGASAKSTYLFTHIHWWESVDHHMTSLVTLLALAKNTSSIAVVPFMPSTHNTPGNLSLIGDFFDIEPIRKVQPALTLSEFLSSEHYKTLKSAKTGTIPFPKDSQEEYESTLNLFGQLRDAAVPWEMPADDPENTNQRCDRLAGTIHVSADGETRFVFLDRIHFMHFCTEKFMPWWYDIRVHIRPRKGFVQIADRFLSEIRKPVAAVHISDLMESQNAREDEEIERYARQIVDALRRRQAIGGSMYVMYSTEGENVERVVRLLRQEFDSVKTCSDVFGCGRDVKREIIGSDLSERDFNVMFNGSLSRTMIEWALGCSSDYFVANVHSPFSRNVCLFRKTHGKPYSMLKGFGELRKIWKWNL